ERRSHRGRGAHGEGRRAPPGDGRRGQGDPRPRRVEAERVMDRKYTRIKVHAEASVFTITLAYPERRNAIGPVMGNELLWARDDARTARELGVVVIGGEGKAFCAGGDFQQMTGGVDAEALPHKGDYADLLITLVNFDKPVVAKVNGPAMGGGLGLVA